MEGRFDRPMVPQSMVPLLTTEGENQLQELAIVLAAGSESSTRESNHEGQKEHTGKTGTGNLSTRGQKRWAEKGSGVDLGSILTPVLFVPLAPLRESD